MSDVRRGRPKSTTSLLPSFAGFACASWITCQICFAAPHTQAALDFERLGVYKIVAATQAGGIAAGSAVLIAPGKMITSCHTVRDAKSIRISHPQGQLEAKLVQAAYAHDLCALSAPQFNNGAAPRIKSASLSEGQPVVAVGFDARGHRLSATAGHIVALYPFEGAMVIRTTATFPRGASGGGLFDEGGNLVGVLTFRNAASADLNYAVPADWVDGLIQLESRDGHVIPSALPFWDDEAAEQPRFLAAAELEARKDWKRLHEHALDWLLAAEADSEAWVSLGRAKLALREYKEAAIALRRAVDLNPATARGWLWLALSYEQAGRREESIQANRRVTQLAPGLSDASARRRLLGLED